MCSRAGFQDCGLPQLGLALPAVRVSNCHHLPNLALRPWKLPSAVAWGTLLFIMGSPESRPEIAESPVLDPVVELYKSHVDRTLLRENLKRSPAERVANLVELQRLADEARRAGRTSSRDT